MYPFGSGMPHQHATSGPGYNNHSQQPGMPAGVPFGAGWIAPTQHPHQQQQQQQQQHQQTTAHYQQHQTQQSYNQSPYHSTSAPYPPNHNTAPYPTHNNAAAPYPTNQSAYPSNNSAPYPTSSPYPSHTAPYPSNQPPNAPNGGHSAPYPGSSYPHNPHQAPYPTSSSTSSSQYHNPYYSSQPSNHPTSYNPTHGYTPVRTSCGLESPAGNIQHCFEELAQRQGQTIQHHSLPRKELQANAEFSESTTEDDSPWELLDGAKSFDEYSLPDDSKVYDQHQRGTPTLFPAQQFDPIKDAHDLRKAMRGFGTDEDALINIICRRSNEQRQEIQRQYKTHFGKDLIEDIKSETSGNFEKLLVGLLRPIVDYYCVELNDAMAGLGTDEDVLIEILCTLSNQEIHIIKNQYLRLYGAHLESELKSETSGNFKRLLVSLCTAARNESGQTDRTAAQNDARELLKAGELRVGTDESMFNMILCHRNYQQLKLIFQEYESMTGHSLEKAIKKEFSGDIMEGLIAICRCVTNKAEYFATRLHKSMAGIGTNDKQLIRVIITRCEIDLGDIKAAYERLYGKSLKSWIKGDTSGHYKHALYALCGEQRSNS